MENFYYGDKKCALFPNDAHLYQNYIIKNSIEKRMGVSIDLHMKNQVNQHFDVAFPIAEKSFEDIVYSIFSKKNKIIIEIIILSSII